jgi:hypothetical protein
MIIIVSLQVAQFAISILNWARKMLLKRIAGISTIPFAFPHGCNLGIPVRSAAADR